VEIKFFCPRWGSEHLEWEVFLKKVKTAGYDGVEIGIPSSQTSEEIRGIWELLDQFQLTGIAQHYDTVDADFSRHYDNYGNWLEKIKVISPLMINSQTGRDYFSFEQNKSLIQLAQQFSEQNRMPVVHETHRSKFSFAAHITKQYLSLIPDLRIAWDVSHWVNVAESYLPDQQKAVDLAISRTDHIHARVGFPESPQINDPRAPEWKEAIQAHFKWWDQVVLYKRNQNEALLTMTPEFGPSPYMPLMPYTRKPLSDQWDINEYMMKLLKARYAAPDFK
jgi:sugar phosphate isomerase/epimerase